MAGTDVTVAPFEVVLAWLRSVFDIEPVPEAWVPGAKPEERRRLAVLGGLVKALMGQSAQSDPHPAFAEPDLRRWLSAGPVPPEDVVLAGKRVLAEEQEDGLARLYGSVVTGESRRTLGTFFTQPTEVRWMIERWTEHYPDPLAVVDVGAGVGIFTTTAAARWPTAQVWSVDINPITLGLLALRVHDEFSLRAPDESGAGLRIVQGDFTLWIENRWPQLPGGRLILGNPPYTRLQLLPPDQRERLWGAARGLCGRRASLSALITAMALKALQREDGLCLLLPAQWLESDYASALRSYIWSLTARRVELHLFEEQLFNDAEVDAVALIVGPEQSTTQPLSFSRGRDSWQINRGLRAPSRWRPLFTGASATPTAPTGVSLGSFLAVRRGVATGANAFFVVQERVVPETKVARSVLTPLIRRLNGLPDVVTAATLNDLPDEQRYWLLTASQKSWENLKGLRAYVEQGEKAGLDRRLLCQMRRRWYDLTSEVFRPDLVIGQSTKDAFRIVENRAEATLVNNLYGMSWRPAVSQATRAALLKWLRSADGQLAIKAQARLQGAGLLKIEPRALERVQLPDRFRSPEETLL